MGLRGVSETEGALLTLTPAAVEQVGRIRSADERAGMVVRVTVLEDSPGAFRYTLRWVPESEREAGDRVVDADGALLYVDEESAPRLQGATLDFVDGIQGAGFTFENPNKPPLLNDPLAARVHALIEERVAPGVASHGGQVTLLDVRDGKIYVRLGGGCQGCGMVDVTLKQGIEAMLRAEIPEITEVLDTTDHAAGTNPYYSS